MKPIHTITPENYPSLLKEIPNPPPVLYIEGNLPPEDHKLLCVVGARKHSPYGKEACESLIAGLKGYPITIVSGLALGIDAIAHNAALAAGLHTIAVPGSGIDPHVLYPSSNRQLARKIIESGGCMLTEFPVDMPAAPWTFPQRNRIMAGLSHAVLIIEAELKSGTLITGKLATEFNHDIGAVPGSIFSKLSDGPHQLLQLGATPIHTSKDILELLQLPISNTEISTHIYTSEEQKIISLLPCSKEELYLQSDMQLSEFQILLSMMEIKGLIKESLGQIIPVSN